MSQDVSVERLQIDLKSTAGNFYIYFEPSVATFGDLKKRCMEKTGIDPKKQTCMFY